MLILDTSRVFLKEILSVCTIQDRLREDGSGIFLHTSRKAFSYSQNEQDLPSVAPPLPYLLKGVRSSVSRKKSQNFLTEEIWTFSSGECAARIFGPKDIISVLGKC